MLYFSAVLLPYPNKKTIVCGCDEAGRGPLAGPVVAAAVILPPRFRHKLLNDSKAMKEPERDRMRLVIQEKALAWGVGILDHLQIDEHNILRASFLAMHAAIDRLTLRPELIIVDGNRFIPYADIRHECHIKGDGKYAEIAAASVLAKTVRDEIMLELHEEFPMYEWDRNKGYPTVRHRAAIREYGPSPYHRRSFRLLKEEENQ